MRDRDIWLSALLIACGCRTASTEPATLPTSTATATRSSPRTSKLCVSAGKLRLDEAKRGLMLIDSPGVRATLVGSSRAHRGTLAFTYRGPSHVTEPLANGEIRRQIGLKIRAKDTCNVVYAMWHIEPTHGVFVSVKSNPGMSRHEQCGDRGYTNLKSSPHSSHDGVWTDRTEHTLIATLSGPSDRHLRVEADGVVAFDDDLPSNVIEGPSAFEGPFGLRSDNGVFDATLRTDNDDASTELSTDCL